MEQAERDVLGHAQVGDADAYGELLARHRPSALRVATVILGSAHDADDVVQIASERAWRAIGAVDPGRGFRPWFLRIVANTARNHRRARWRRRAAELRVAGHPSAVAADPEALAVSQAERELVIAAMNTLDADARLVIALRHFEQLGEQEMAEVLVCPPGTVKSRLSRAMARLRAEFGAEPIGEATKHYGRLVGTAEPAEQAGQNRGAASGQTYPLEPMDQEARRDG